MITPLTIPLILMGAVLVGGFLYIFVGEMDDKARKTLPYRVLIILTFLGVLWLIADPHYEPAQRIVVDRPQYLLNDAIPHTVPYESICTSDNGGITDYNLIKTKWTTYETCAYVEQYNKFVLFKQRSR